MPQIFPYGITLHEDGKMALFPAAEVLFTTKDGEKLSLFLIIDSGATVSALPKSDAPGLGIDVEHGTPVMIGGIGEEMIKGWRHEILIRLGQEDLRLPFVFLDSMHAPRVLGREGVFEKFVIIFEEIKRRSILIKNNESAHLKIAMLLEVS